MKAKKHPKSYKLTMLLMKLEDSQLSEMDPLWFNSPLNLKNLLELKSIL